MYYGLTRIRAALLVPVALLVQLPAASGQVQGLSTCREFLAVDPISGASTAEAFCRPTATVQDGRRRIPYEIAVRAAVTATSVPQLYDVSITADRSGDFPAGLLYGRAELRSSQESCALDVFDAVLSTTCVGMFSNDGEFVLFVEAFDGALP